jgi:hypothetical protein
MTHVKSDATPVERYYGLAHNSEFAIEPMLANWGELGLFQFGVPVTVDPDASPPAPPYGGTHILKIQTELQPQTFTDVVPLQDHRLTARDVYVDKLQEQHPSAAAALLQAWHYINSMR